jgi:hypothetical protein
MHFKTIAVTAGLGLLLAAGVTFSVAQPAAAQGSMRKFGAKVEITEPQSGPVFVGGADVGISAPVTGDVWAAGADVAIDGPGVGSVTASGAEIKVNARIAGGATLMGSRVTLDASAGGDVSVMASQIEVGPQSTVGGQLKLYGNTITYRGQSNDRVSIEGTDITFAGGSRGSVHLEGLKVRITETARIEGPLDIYTVGEPEIAPGAKITGPINRHKLTDSTSMRAYMRGLPFGFVIPAAVGASALIAGLFLLWLGRGGVERVVDEIIDSPGASGLWGLATLILLPLIAALLALTVFGLPVGVVALLALPLLLLLGFATTGFGIGEWLFNRLGDPRSSGQRALQLLGGLTILVLLGLIPLAGPIVLGLAGITGLGALLRSLHDGMRIRAGF